jgi:iron complex transport system substrate-binding protein
MRIVSLLASATEMIAELGCLEQMVGRSHECDYPPEVCKLPLVSRVQIDSEGSSAEIDAQIKQLINSQETIEAGALKALSIYTIDTELLSELRPDAIFTQTQCEVCAVSERDVSAALQQITGLQPRIISLAPYRLEDVWEDFLRVGKALGREEQAQILLESYQQRLKDLQALTSRLQEKQKKKRVAVIEWLEPLMGAGNWVPELLEFAGGQACFGERGEHSPWISWEELREADPDVIVLCPCGFTLERTERELGSLQGNDEWKELRAVQQGEVYAIDGNYYLNRSGPRLVDSAEILGRVIWGSELEGVKAHAQGWRKVE